MILGYPHSVEDPVDPPIRLAESSNSSSPVPGAAPAEADQQNVRRQINWGGYHKDGDAVNT